MVKLKSVLPPARAEDEMTRLVNDTPMKQENRHYNGLSAIGTKCVRRLQYTHYDCLDITHSARMIRLFGVGHTMEPKLRKELEMFLGMTFKGDQDQVVGFAGHWKGHIDGLGMFVRSSKFYTFDDDWFLMEYKTHKASSFADLIHCHAKQTHRRSPIINIILRPINQYDAKSLAAAIHLSGRGEVVAKILNELYFRRVA